MIESIRAAIERAAEIVSSPIVIAGALIAAVALVVTLIVR